MNLSVDAPRWEDRACATEDPELFFPIGRRGDPYRELQVALAKSICQGCPFRIDCLTFALEHREECGIWGGEEIERGRILPASTMPAECGTPRGYVRHQKGRRPPCDRCRRAWQDKVAAEEGVEIA